MSAPEGISLFSFPESLKVSWDEVDQNWKFPGNGISDMEYEENFYGSQIERSDSIFCKIL